MGRPAAGTCEGCGANILWITLLTFTGGGWHPVDAEPEETPAVGMIAVRRMEMQGLVGLELTQTRMAKRLAEFITKGCRWHKSHFATCPDAQRFRQNPDQLGLL
jgi:hypothetical protein